MQPSTIECIVGQSRTGTPQGQTWEQKMRLVHNLNWNCQTQIIIPHSNWCKSLKNNTILLCQKPVGQEFVQNFHNREEQLGPLQEWNECHLLHGGCQETILLLLSIHCERTNPLTSADGILQNTWGILWVKTCQTLHFPLTVICGRPCQIGYWTKVTRNDNSCFPHQIARGWETEKFLVTWRSPDSSSQVPHSTPHIFPFTWLFCLSEPGPQNWMWNTFPVLSCQSKPFSSACTG